MKKLMLLVIVIVIFCSCKKEVNKEPSNEFINPYKPQVDTTKLILEKSIPLHEDFEPRWNFFIEDDKLYTMSQSGKMIIITNLNGELVTLIDAIGEGPGEFIMPLNIFNDIPDNRIGVADIKNKRTSYFDYAGNHLEDIKSETMQNDMSSFFCGNVKIRYYDTLIIEKLSGKMYLEERVEVVSGKKPVNIFESVWNFTDSEQNPQEIMPWVVTSNNLIYITTRRVDDYKIEVYNPDGSHSMNIVKEFKKIKRTTDELNEIEESRGEKIDNDDIYSLYKLSINKMLVDERNQLWVQSIDDEGSVWDIFNQDGIIVSQARIDDYIFGSSYFYDSKLYEITTDDKDDEQYILNVYGVK